MAHGEPAGAALQEDWENVMITIERHAATLALAQTDGATLVGRVFRPVLGGPSVVRIAGGRAFGVSATFATVRDLCEMADPAAALNAAEGEDIGAVA